MATSTRRPRLSVVTLVRNRNSLLSGLMVSLSQQSAQDFELIVVRAGGDEDPNEVISRFDVECRVEMLETGDDDQIAYSDARNLGARVARGESLMFVDADTLLGPDSVASMTAALDGVDALCTGSLLYLPPDHPDIESVGYRSLAASARPHPARPTTPPTEWRLGEQHHLVWGLNMGMRRTTFEEVGGFDESFSGYAGEDTDLGKALQCSGRRSAFVAGVEILHQHHDSFDPPVQQFRATLRNAERFAGKWGEWPMAGWLDGFERMGLIDRSTGELRVLRDPTPREIERARCTMAAPFRTSSRP